MNTQVKKRVKLSSIVLLSVVLLLSLATFSTAQSCDVTVKPGQSIQNAINSRGPGATICLADGVHRLQTFTPRSGQTIQGSRDAIVNGAILLDSDSAVWDGNYWVISGVTLKPGKRIQGCAPYGGANNGQGEVRFQDTDGALPYNPPKTSGWYKSCNQPNDLYLDDKVVWPTEKKSDIRSGAWFFDDANNKIFMANDPRGKKLELGSKAAAINKGSATDVTLKGFTVEKYANAAQKGAVWMGTRWVMDDMEVRFTHGTGVRIANSVTTKNSYIHHNGQLGIGGVGKGKILMEGNEISYNNMRFYYPYWEGGGTKWVHTNGLTVRNNYVHHNFGPGLWTDIDNINTLYEGNLVVLNRGPGLSHEISYGAVIRNNDFRFNGREFTNWLWGSQIMVQNSKDVEVHDNYVVTNIASDGIVIINQDRGNGPQGEYLSKNNYLHDNTVVVLAGGQSGMVSDNGNKCAKSFNNRFDRNTYHMNSLGGNQFEYCKLTNFNGMRARDQELNGQAIKLTNAVRAEAENIPDWDGAATTPPPPPPPPTGCQVPEGDVDYCKFCGPCEVGEGDCDSNAECVAGAECIEHPDPTQPEDCTAIATSTIAVNSLSLINANNAQVKSTLTNGAVINLNDGPISIRANTNPGTVGSVAFYVDGSLVQTENVVPYAIAGNPTPSTYSTWSPSVGTHTIRAVPYSSRDRGGSAGSDYSISVTVTQDSGGCQVPVGNNDYCKLCGPCEVGQGDCDSNSECVAGAECIEHPDPSQTEACTAIGTTSGPEVVSFDLINANTAQVKSALTNGATINLADGPISIRANTNPNEVGRVSFYVNGQLAKTETVYPYSIAGNPTPSTYNAWSPSPGQYSVEAIPYKLSGSTATPGNSATVSFTVVANQPAVCGNGNEETGEQCDDGNVIDGDGCQSNCMDPICGDGIHDLNEECDDDNNANGDGCSSTCSVEVPFVDNIPENAFRGDYFNDVDFKQLAQTTQDATIDFNWGTSKPLSSVAANTYSVRWVGDWRFKNTGTYEFTVRADDGIRVWVDDRLILDEWRDQGATTFTSQVQLIGGYHRVRVEYYENAGSAAAHVDWKLVGASNLAAAPAQDNGVLSFVTGLVTGNQSNSTQTYNQSLAGVTFLALIGLIVFLWKRK